MSEALPTPVRQDNRICFYLEWYATEEEANTVAEFVREQKECCNGGFYHGMLCGRSSSFDTTRDNGSKLFAVMRGYVTRDTLQPYG